jgi:hypothetical protein
MPAHRQHLDQLYTSPTVHHRLRQPCGAFDAQCTETILLLCLQPWHGAQARARALLRSCAT